MKTEKEIRKMLKKAIKHPELFWGTDPIVTTLKWVLDELGAVRNEEA